MPFIVLGKCSVATRTPASIRGRAGPCKTGYSTREDLRPDRRGRGVSRKRSEWCDDTGWIDKAKYDAGIKEIWCDFGSIWLTEEHCSGIACGGKIVQIILLADNASPS
jgi:hypothetical protein